MRKPTSYGLKTAADFPRQEGDASGRALVRAQTGFGQVYPDAVAPLKSAGNASMVTVGTATVGRMTSHRTRQEGATDGPHDLPGASPPAPPGVHAQHRWGAAPAGEHRQRAHRDPRHRSRGLRL